MIVKACCLLLSYLSKNGSTHQWQVRACNLEISYLPTMKNRCRSRPTVMIYAKLDELVRHRLRVKGFVAGKILDLTTYDISAYINGFTPLYKL